MAASRGRPFEWEVDGGEELPVGIDWDENLYMAPQAYSWNCSACALDWVLRATWLAPSNHTPAQAVQEIGYPEQINAQVGLTNIDGPGAALQAVLTEYGQASRQGWLDFDTVYQLALATTGMMSGGAWYHWIALRGVQGSNLWIANSAQGYKGVWEILSREDFARLGPFNVVWLVEE